MAAKTIIKIDADLLDQVAGLIAAAVGRGEALGLVAPILPRDYRSYVDDLLDEADRGDAGLVAAVDHGRVQGIELLGLDVRGNNHGAIALYERCGFRRTGKWENAVAVGRDRHDVLLMARELYRPQGVRLHGEAA